MIKPLIQAAEQSSLKADVPQFEVGDTVDVHTRIIEGKKERIQVFTGDVISKRGRGVTETFIVRRLVAGEGVERVFPVHSPAIAKVVIRRSGRIRRAKLYYLRDRVGKATRLAEKKSVTKTAKPTGGSKSRERVKGEQNKNKNVPELAAAE